MGKVNVLIGGRSYPLACRDGEEGHLVELAGILESKTGGLIGALGAMSEPRLLLMAGILVADELFESRKRGVSGAAAPAVADHRVTVVAERLEALANHLEHGSLDHDSPSAA